MCFWLRTAWHRHDNSDLDLRGSATRRYAVRSPRPADGTARTFGRAGGTTEPQRFAAKNSKPRFGRNSGKTVAMVCELTPAPREKKFGNKNGTLMHSHFFLLG